MDLEEEKEEEIYCQLTCFPGMSGLWVNRKCLMYLGAGLSARGERYVKSGWSVGSKGDVAGEEEGCAGVLLWYQG